MSYLLGLSVLLKGSFDLYGAVAVRQASPRLHDLAAYLSVLPAPSVGAPLLPPNLPTPETSQVTPFSFHSLPLITQFIHIHCVLMSSQFFSGFVC